MYAFVRRPAWLGLHIVVLVITTAFLLLGNWQLRRLDERKTENVAIQERLTGAPSDWDASMPSPLEYTWLRLSGVYQPLEEVLLRSQVSQGQPGYDLLTPLYLADQSVVVVNRGWVPLEYDSPPVQIALPPTGNVTIEGLVRLPLSGDIEGISEPGVFFATVDLSRIDRQVDGDVESFYLELTAGESASVSLPIRANPPDLGDGPHLSYAIQWFSFALVAVGGYLALIRSAGRRPR